MSSSPQQAGAETMSGGQALALALRSQGAGPMFGMGGFQLLPFYEAARSIGLRHILINDERCGAFAADAYARVSGRVGLVDGTLGPGATNLVTGLVESLNAGVPVVAVTGNAARQHSWKNMTQECRQTEILRPAVKDLIRIEDAQRIPELVARAFAVATTGRPGPVVLDVPEDVAHAAPSFAPAAFAGAPRPPGPALRCRPAGEDVARAVRLLAAARRPVILAGGGVHLSLAYGPLQRLAEALGAPVAHTLSGKGAIACSHPLSIGLFGRYSRFANDLIAAADLLLVVGCKLGEIATKRYALLPAGVPVIHLDSLAEEFGRTTPAAVALWGDAAAGLEDLADGVDRGAAPGDGGYAREIAERRDRWAAEARARYTSDERPIGMARLIAELNRLMPARSILVADGGFAAHWTGLLYDTKEAGRRYVADRGLASIGYGVPGSIGAQLGDPEATVVGVTGDGGFNMMLGELETARRLGLPITLVVINNAASGYVKALQHAAYGAGHYQSSDLVEMDYGAIARAMGCHGRRVEDPADLAGALAEAMAERSRPSVVDVVVTRDPARMLPAIDNRVLKVVAGDRPV